jgi:hypothetical protein
MTVSRLRSTEAITNSADYWPNLSAAYSAGGSSWSTYQFTGNGQDSINGQNYRVHRLELSSLGSQFAVSTTISFSKAGYIDFILVAGGGAAGMYNTVGGAGGGAGGVVMQYGYYVDATSYAASVGIGGLTYSANGPGTDGGNSVFAAFTAVGGGGGGTTSGIGRSGGSGGGTSYNYAASPVGTSGTAGQGNAGGGKSQSSCASGGGGWATAAPYNSYGTDRGSNGGDGLGTYFDGTFRAFACGGGAGSTVTTGGLGGSVNGVVYGGTGLLGGSLPALPTAPGCGGGGNSTYPSGSGSGGMLLIRYKI